MILIFVVNKLLRNGSEVYKGPYSIPGNGTIWLDDLACFGYETSVDQCYKKDNAWGSHNCRHREDVGVKCRQSKL